MFHIIEEDTGRKLLSFGKLAEAKEELLQQPEGYFIFDEERNSFIFTEDGGMSWVYEPQGVEAVPQTVPTDPTRAQWTQDEADYQEWLTQQEG